MRTTLITATASFIGIASLVNGQAASPKPAPDELVLKDGEKLIGQLQSATGTAATFKSDALGVLTIDWSKVQELHSSQIYAAIPKAIALKKSTAATVPVGKLAFEDQKLQITPAAPAALPQAIPVNAVSNVVSDAEFQKALSKQTFHQGWKGGASGGVAVTDSTQKSQTYTASLNLIRAMPAVSWLAPKSRTLLDLNEAYGKLTQPNTPRIKTSIFHGDVEEDFYLSPRYFAFLTAALDHNFSQGLKLQQNYGGGFGVVAIKDAKQELDFRAGANYIDQRFDAPDLNQKLIGSSFGETYNRTLPRNILFAESLVATPAWNNTNAYSAIGGANLTFPVYRRFAFTTAVLDNFLNDPPPGFRKNSFQFTIGATYTIQ